MKNLQKEFLVGCLVITVLILMGVFAWLMGALQPFSSTVRYHLLYGFAGGIEKGSLVRVAGVKVGKVDSIEFLAENRKDSEDPVALKLTVSVSKAAAPSVRKDSRFYVNMAGVIGERYIEISPGTLKAEGLNDGSTVRGVDLPRIDQLLSQGYGVFSKIQTFMEDNEQTVTELFSQLPKVLTAVTSFLKKEDWRKLVKLMDNVNALTTDIWVVTKKLRKPEA